MVNQREGSQRKKHITFMLLPHSSSRNVWRINLPYWLAAILAVLLVAVLIGVIGSFFYSTRISARMINYYGLKAENKRQEKQLKVFVEKTKELEEGVRELEERDQELREMLGLQKGRSARPVRQAELLASDPELVFQRLVALEKKIISKKQVLVQMKKRANDVAFRFASLPSIWPVNGSILCSYGWRRHPFSGKQEFHKGVDIPVWQGYPIKATADGVIVYSGWSNGYGNTVVIDHKNGYSTLYAHCSQLLVDRWDQVAKGQVIAKVGSTGLSTGPHLHYEVEKNNKTVNPATFLDINIRSANKF